MNGKSMIGAGAAVMACCSVALASEQAGVGAALLGAGIGFDLRQSSKAQ